jgi:hypothetical protein
MTIGKSLLDPGEELVWSGRPNAVWFAIRRAWQPLLVGLGFSIASVFVLFQAYRASASADAKYDAFISFAGAFYTGGAVIGLCAILSALWIGFRGSRTTYMLTNKRVLIDTTGPLARRIIIPLEHVRFIERNFGFLGPGDLVFNETRRVTVDGWWPRSEGFIAISNAAHVEKLMREAIEQTFATRTRGPRE